MREQRQKKERTQTKPKKSVRVTESVSQLGDRTPEGIMGCHGVLTGDSYEVINGGATFFFICHRRESTGDINNILNNDTETYNALI